MILTITIPTYNRPEKVKATLLRLIPQLRDEVCIRVLDNCSNTNVRDYIKSQLGDEVTGKIEFIRHRVNIGGDANFQRCFELCTTPYIWMLGDDDAVVENAVDIILKEIEAYKNLDLIGFNFNSSLNPIPRTHAVTLHSLSDMVSKLDHFWNWVFISTSVYKTDSYLKYLYSAGWGAYSMASQIIPAMIAISHNQAFVLSEKFIVVNIPVENPQDNWSNISLSLGLTTILEAPVGFTKNQYLEFGKKIGKEFDGFKRLFFILLKSVQFNIGLIDNYHIYIYGQVYERTCMMRPNKVKNFLLYHSIVFMLKNTIFLKALLQLVPAVKREAEKGVTFHLFKRNNSSAINVLAANTL